MRYTFLWLVTGERSGGRRCLPRLTMTLSDTAEPIGLRAWFPGGPYTTLIARWQPAWIHRLDPRARTARWALYASAYLLWRRRQLRAGRTRSAPE